MWSTKALVKLSPIFCRKYPCGVGAVYEWSKNGRVRFCFHPKEFPVGLAVMWRVRTCDSLGSVPLEEESCRHGMVSIFKVSVSSVFVSAGVALTRLSTDFCSSTLFLFFDNEQRETPLRPPL